MKPNGANKADLCCQRLAWNDIDPAAIRALVSMAKAEDMEGAGLRARPPFPGDHSAALLPADQLGKATLRARRDMTVCGIELAPIVLAAYDAQLEFEPAASDGQRLARGQSIGTVSGPTRSLLSAERPLLNFLQKLSGIATETRRYADALGETRTRLLDTRKTTPGFRVLEKYAGTCGGAWNHRIGLFDRVMIKDNHLAAFGSDPRQAAIEAVQSCRAQLPGMLVEMEVDTLAQIDIALAAGVDIVLLDNFSPAQLAEAVALIDGRCVTEASGGITLESLPHLAGLGLDFISTGAPVHQSVWIDIGLDWDVS